MLSLPVRHLAILAATSSFALQTLAQIDLGTALPFGIIASTAITSTGNTIISGQLGISPNTASSISGFPPGISGDIHAADGVALQARNDAITAYNAAAMLASTTDITGQDLGGQTLQPGTYSASSSILLTSTLVLDGQTNLKAQFVFQISSALTTSTASSIVLINGAQACNVFWQIGDSATLGTRSTFVGNILAMTSISLNDGVSVAGGLYALNAAVTLINNNVEAQQCAELDIGGTSSISATVPLTLQSSIASDGSGSIPRQMG
jgi:hypothetical protein